MILHAGWIHYILNMIVIYAIGMLLKLPIDRSKLPSFLFVRVLVDEFYRRFSYQRICLFGGYCTQLEFSVWTGT